MATVTLNYWTNLCRCFGGNVNETCNVEMTDEELELFRKINDQATEQAPNIIMAISYCTCDRSTPR